MKVITRYSMFACMVCICFASCKKSSSTNGTFDNDPVKTRTLTYFTQKPWKQTLLEYQLQNGTWISKSLTATQLAYVYTFTTTGYSDGTYTISLNGSQTGTGTWQIIGDNNQVVFDKVAPTYDLATLSDTAMKWQIIALISYTDPVTNVTTQYYGVRRTFSH